jgi:hypothetical protein
MTVLFSDSTIQTGFRPTLCISATTLGKNPL